MTRKDNSGNCTILTPKVFESCLVFAQPYIVSSAHALICLNFEYYLVLHKCVSYKARRVSTISKYEIQSANVVFSLHSSMMNFS